MQAIYLDDQVFMDIISSDRHISLQRIGGQGGDMGNCGRHIDSVL